MVWDKAMKWLHIVVLFIISNCFWVVGVAIGFGIGGLVPSTVALLKVLTLRTVFDNTYSYLELFRYFCQFYLSTLRNNLFPSVLLGALVAFLGLEWFWIGQFELLRAIFLYPLTFLILYVLLIYSHIVYWLVHNWKLDRIGVKVLILSPLLFGKASALAILMLASSVLISARYPLTVFGIFSVFLYSYFKILQGEYQKKESKNVS